MRESIQNTDPVSNSKHSINVCYNNIYFFLKYGFLKKDLFVINLIILFIFGCIGSQFWYAGSSLQYTGSFVAACGLFIVVCGLLSSCGVRVFPPQLWRAGSRARELCSCGVRVPERMGSVFASHRLQLRRESSLVVAHGLRCPCGMWDLSSLTRDRTRVPCSVRWILYPWTTREVPQGWVFFFFFFF